MDQRVNTLLELYKDGASGVVIADNLGIPLRQVYRILEKNGVARRTTAHSNTLRFLKEPPTFHVKERMNPKDKILWVAGLMLYWAEGAHYKNKQVLDFANSDPEMIKIFLRFLREICGIDEARVRVYLYCYANQDIEAVKKFWNKATHVPLSRFTQPYIRHDFREDKIGKMPYGLAHIRYADKKLFIQIEKWQAEMLKLFL